MTTQHVEEQSCLYYWKREQLEYFDARKASRLQSSNKFASLSSIHMQIVIPAEEVEGNELDEDITVVMAEAIENVNNTELNRVGVVAIIAEDEDL